MYMNVVLFVGFDRSEKRKKRVSGVWAEAPPSENEKDDDEEENKEDEEEEVCSARKYFHEKQK